MKTTSEMVCDFCRSDDVVCGFPGPDTAIVMATENKTATWHNTGGWAACEECAKLLEAGRLDDLVNRALDSEANGLSNLPSEHKALYFGLLKGQYVQINRKREAA